MSPNLEKVFSLNISPGMSDGLTARAAQDGVKRSDVVREAIGRYLAGAQPNGFPLGSSGPTADEIADAVAARLRGMPGRPAKPAEPSGTAAGTLASAGDLEALRDRLSGGAQPVVQQQHGTGADVPEPWALAGINTDALRRLQEASAPALGAALAVVLAAAESGELDRADVARIVAARWDLRPGDRLQYDDGKLFREQAPPRRSVQQRAG